MEIRSNPALLLQSQYVEQCAGKSKDIPAFFLEGIAIVCGVDACWAGRCWGCGSYDEVVSFEVHADVIVVLVVVASHVSATWLICSTKSCQSGWVTSRPAPDVGGESENDATAGRIATRRSGQILVLSTRKRSESAPEGNHEGDVCQDQ